MYTVTRVEGRGAMGEHVNSLGRVYGHTPRIYAGGRGIHRVCCRSRTPRLVPSSARGLRHCTSPRSCVVGGMQVRQMI